MAGEPRATSSLPRLTQLSLAALLAFGPACDCGDDGGPMEMPPTPDAGSGDGGQDGPPDEPEPMAPGFMPDVGDLIEGEPPEELAEEACAVDTNKLFQLAESEGIVGDTVLGVDLIESEFGMVFVDVSNECTHAVRIARFSGPAGSGEPEVELALDACSTIGRTAVAHNDEAWLLVTVDDRDGPMDVWIQRVGDRTGDQGFRLSDSPSEEVDVAAMAAPPLLQPEGAEPLPDIALEGYGAVAWIDSDAFAGTRAMFLQMLTVDGEPNGDPIVLYDHGSMDFTSVTLARVGTDKIGLGYRRFDRMGISEIMFEVRDAVTGELEREPWLITPEGGQQGTIELATDETGGGIAYSVEQGTEGRQVWFIRLDANGEIAPVQSGVQQGGPSEPQRVVGLPYKGVDASIAKLPVGYAVVFRGLPGGPITESLIRIQFIDRFGRLIDQASSIAFAAEIGGRTTVEAAFDGRIAVGWTDATEDLMGTTVNVVRLPCVR